eukprot:TRINITY_DN5898_c0_g1_i10.p2 TRINITY_DN5898_c0_g1~~TRINITY_DN5898_c0_g1_i10.p2  ORF type:complete len:189 (-),score=-4.04 TRINITY_DN5898_c0_g1_i10:1439-2005(-)
MTCRFTVFFNCIIKIIFDIKLLLKKCNGIFSCGAEQFLESKLLLLLILLFNFVIFEIKTGVKFEQKLKYSKFLPLLFDLCEKEIYTYVFIRNLLEIDELYVFILNELDKTVLYDIVFFFVFFVAFNFTITRQYRQKIFWVDKYKYNVRGGNTVFVIYKFSILGYEQKFTGAYFYDILLIYFLCCYGLY